MVCLYSSDGDCVTAYLKQTYHKFSIIYYLPGCKFDKSLGRVQPVCDGTGHLAFNFLNVDQLFKNHYFRYLFNVTFCPGSSYLCAEYLNSLHGVETKPSKQRLLTVNLATGVCKLHCFSISLIIVHNLRFLLFFWHLMISKQSNNIFKQGSA